MEFKFKAWISYFFIYHWLILICVSKSRSSFLFLVQKGKLKPFFPLMLFNSASLEAYLPILKNFQLWSLKKFVMIMVEYWE